MLHTLMVQLAESGGEIVLALLFAVSVVSVAIITNRVWSLLSQRAQTDRLAGQLLQAICASDWGKAWAATQRSKTSIAQVIAAGLTQIERGRQAVRSAICSARVRERTRLEGPLAMLNALGQSAVLLGLLGTLLDLVQLAQESGGGRAAAGAKETGAFAAMDALGPAAAGLIVAIPALLAAGFLKYRVQLSLRQIDTLAHLLLLQVEEQRPAATLETPTAAKAA